MRRLNWVQYKILSKVHDLTIVSADDDYALVYIRT